MITVRRAVPEDSEILNHLFYKGALETYNQESPISFNQIQELTKTYFCIGKFINIFFDGDRLVGACSHEVMGQILSTVHINVDENFRGLGLAHKMLLMDKALYGGPLMSIVPESNERSIKSFLRAGYLPIGYMPNCWNQGGNIIGRVILFKE